MLSSTGLKASFVLAVPRYGDSGEDMTIWLTKKLTIRFNLESKSQTNFRVA